MFFFISVLKTNAIIYFVHHNQQQAYYVSINQDFNQHLSVLHRETSIKGQRADRKEKC